MSEGFSLPDTPSEAVDTEDCVAALFQASGYHVHRNIIQAGPSENVPELDAVATNYAQAPASAVLVEAKSGGWGYSDCFKVSGGCTTSTSSTEDSLSPMVTQLRCRPESSAASSASSISALP
jgi:hypothetical protein